MASFWLGKLKANLILGYGMVLIHRDFDLSSKTQAATLVLEVLTIFRAVNKETVPYRFRCCPGQLTAGHDNHLDAARARVTVQRLPAQLTPAS